MAARQLRSSTALGCSCRPPVTLSCACPVAAGEDPESAVLQRTAEEAGSSALSALAAACAGLPCLPAAVMGRAPRWAAARWPPPRSAPAASAVASSASDVRLRLWLAAGLACAFPGTSASSAAALLRLGVAVTGAPPAASAHAASAAVISASAASRGCCASTAILASLLGLGSNSAAAGALCAGGFAAWPDMGMGTGIAAALASGSASALMPGAGLARCRSAESRPWTAVPTDSMPPVSSSLVCGMLLAATLLRAESGLEGACSACVPDLTSSAAACAPQPGLMRPELGRDSDLHHRSDCDQPNPQAEFSHAQKAHPCTPGRASGSDRVRGAAALAARLHGGGKGQRGAGP
jgi:hypothetical protein